MMSWSSLPLTEEHAARLEAAAISAAVAKEKGLRSITEVADLPEWASWAGEKAVPAIVFPWVDMRGQVVEQLRPDVEFERAGNRYKYLFPKSTRSILNVLRQVPHSKKALMVEGTKQGLAALSHAPADWSVYGMAGCRNWSTDGSPIQDLEVFDGCEVVVILDADVSSNPEVWQAGERLARALDYNGATGVRFAKLAGGAKSGLDDELALSAAPERRGSYLAKVIEKAGKLPRKPSAKAKKAEEGDGEPDEAARYFSQEIGLLVDDLCRDIRDKMPAALTEEQRVAIYSGGVYNIDKTAIVAAVGKVLKNRNRPSIRQAVEEQMISQLVNEGLYLPTYSSEALLNVKNGMLDLETLTLKPHDPIYFSAQQIPIDWNPEATCPTYLEWVEKCGVADQLNDLEEATSTMLDPSRTPTKAVFLFGPSRSGKSTYLRLMQAIVSPRNYSAVTLHQLSENRFSAANVFGKMLNCAADLSAAHVEDISIFKMMAGDDPIQADRKYGSQFAFINRALFAFSANELPTVGESSRAYVERIKPFEFPVSFAGREDPRMEEQMMREELPGILVRWVKAWQRRQGRGGRPLPTNPEVLHKFEVKSDRVRQWIDSRCQISTTDADGNPVTYGSKVGQNQALTKSEIAKAFNAWADEHRASHMGMGKVIERVLNIVGVFEVRRGSQRVRAINVTVRAGEDAQPWDEPRADLGLRSARAGNSELPAGSFGADPETGIARESEQVNETRADLGATRAVFAHKPHTYARRACRGSSGEGRENDIGGEFFSAETARSAPGPLSAAERPWPGEPVEQPSLFAEPEPALVPAAPAERPALLPTPPVNASAVLPGSWVDLFTVDAPGLSLPSCTDCGAQKVPDSELGYFLLCPRCTPGTLRPADPEVTR